MRAALLLLLPVVVACRRPASTNPPRSTDAATPRDVAVTVRDVVVSADATQPTDAMQPLGPPSPWGPGGLPDSTAPAGPELATTRTRMTLLRAAIGFWRVDRDARSFCPTLDDLQRTSGTGFDRATMGTDGWGSPFEIDCLGTRVRIRALGPDRVRETPDDVFSE